MPFSAACWETFFSLGAGATYYGFTSNVRLVLAPSGGGSSVTLSPSSITGSSVYWDSGMRCRDFYYMFNTASYIGYNLVGLTCDVASGVSKGFWVVLSGTVEQSQLSVVLTVKVLCE